jgi:hypothetical protein
VSKLRLFGIVGIIVASSLVLLLGTMVLAASYSGFGVTSDIGTGGLPLSLSDLSDVPQSVMDGATSLAEELFGDCREKCDDFINQLLAAYSEAKGKDFVIVFNPGGWGWNLVEDSPGWQSIFEGIKSELESLSYTLLELNYQRAADTFRGRLDEFKEMINGYQSKAKELACRVEFLITYLPDLRVILTGESTGTVIADDAMQILGDNPRVYSIQTGPPPWHQTAMSERTLVITDNGITIDSFSQGNFFNILWGYYKKWFGLLEPEDGFGTIPHYIAARGHDYWWQYPEVCSRITGFLRDNFGLEEITY